MSHVLAIPDAELSGLAARVIPCLDVAGGELVKGVRFAELRSLGDPAAAARRYVEQGADELVFLDITAASERRQTDLDWVERVAEEAFVPLTVGGGVRRVEDARRLVRAGADKVGINSAAVERPELISEIADRFGRQCVVLSVDAKRRVATDASSPAEAPGSPRWQLVTQGGRQETGLDVLEWIAAGVEAGAGEILLTSIDRDGTQSGYDLELLRAAAVVAGVPIIASGGAGCLEDLAPALEAGAAAVLAASIFHDGRLTVGQVKDELGRCGFRVRRKDEE